MNNTPDTLLQAWCRGTVVQSRGVSVLTGLAHRNTRKGKQRAAQALAKIVISTNPSLIPEPQMMDVIGPLVALTQSEDQLQQVLLLPSSFCIAFLIAASLHCCIS